MGNTMANNVEKRADCGEGSPEDSSPQREPRNPTIVCGNRAGKSRELLIFGSPSS